MNRSAKLRFLWNAANTLPTKTHTGNLLKSYYLTICRKISQSNDNENVLQLLCDEKRMCSKCSSYWFDGNFTVETISNHLKRSKGERLIDSYKKERNLTRKQKIRSKWIMKKLNNYMVVICNICKHKTKIPLKNPTKKFKGEKTNKVDNQEQESEISRTVKTKKKKKKKDKFAGLKMKIKEEYTPKIVSTSPPVSVSSSIQSKNPTSKSQPSSLKITKKSPQQKQKSKTQQKNALLQLAQVLKSSNESNYQNTNKNDRLKNLLL